MLEFRKKFEMARKMEYEIMKIDRGAGMNSVTFRELILCEQP
jgi:hypothetical protein